MTFLPKHLVRLAPLVFTLSCAAQPTPHTIQGQEGAPQALAPIFVPAAPVKHVTQATMLASARAGARIVAVGDHGVVLLSDDGGKTHRQAKQVPVDVTLTSVSFVDALNGWAVGHWGVVLRTQDGGETWARQRSDTQQDRPLFAVHFFNAKEGVAVGLWSLVLVTHDGGVNWQTITIQPPEGSKRADLNLLGLFADAKGNLYAPGERGMVLRSDDRGQQWRYLPTGYAGSFWTGTALPNGGLLVAGLRGSMYRSDDDAKTWQRVNTGSQSSITALASSGSQVLGVGLDGLTLRSRDDGANFAMQTREDRLPLTAALFNDQGVPVIYSRQGVVAPDKAGMQPK
jgi:photosystem II stability/assembly factor-like uncharacterized protein